MSLTVTPSGSLEAERAERIVSALEAPAPQAKLIEWVTLCAVLTAQPRDDDMTSELKLRAYVEKLAEYPGDIVREVLSDWPGKSKWFPTWAELKAALDKHAGVRPLLVDRVRAEIKRSKT
jgi:hypothetical protein